VRGDHSAGAIDHSLVDRIAAARGEPDWMREFRHAALDVFFKKPTPRWGADLAALDLARLRFDVQPHPTGRALANSWAAKGVLFLDTTTALRRYPDLVRRYWASVLPPDDNKYCALNSALWETGTFIYVPANVHVDAPLAWSLHLTADRTAHFERALIIVDSGGSVQCAEECTTEPGAEQLLHAGVVEIVVADGGRCRYGVVQRWGGNVYNLVTKRARIGKRAQMEWVDANLGSRVTMTYPAVYLQGEQATAEIFALAQAGSGEHLDAGGKVVFEAPQCSGQIQARTLSLGTGRTSYRGLVKVTPGATGCVGNVQCDALLVGADAHTDVYPHIEIDEPASAVGHRAGVRRVEERALEPLMAGGLSRVAATSQLVREFAEPMAERLPEPLSRQLRAALDAAVERADSGVVEMR